MPFQLSPGVNVTEIDLTGIVPAVATSDGAIAGIFQWGPVGTRRLISSEADLVSTFGKPNSNNAETWFTAANFLSYANRLWVVRGANTTSLTSTVGALSAVANVGSVTNVAACTVRNDTVYASLDGTFDTDVLYIARYPGAIGNSLKVSVCDSAAAYSSTLAANGKSVVTGSSNLDVVATTTLTLGSNAATVNCIPGGTGTAEDANTYATALVANLTIGDYITAGNSALGTQYLKVTSISSISANSTGAYFAVNFEDNYRLASNFTSNGSVNSTIRRNWEHFNIISTAPGQSNYQAMFGNTSANDQLHIVVSDEKGKFTGVPGTILESYADLSIATDNKTESGAANYYKTVIENNSRYIHWANDRSGATSNNSTNIASSTNRTPITVQFASGTDGYTESTAPLGTLAAAYDYFNSPENVDISLIMQGKPIGGSTTVNGQTIQYTQLANYIIDNIVEVRKDCVLFISPDDTLVQSNPGNQAQSLVNWRGAIHDSSYAVMDTGYKYQYDRYNDVYRYIPMNGDIAGLCARTDNTRDPWWSPAGFNRGQIKNLLRLRWNPTKADRDILYKNGVNPVVTFPGQGTVLFGDKTVQTKPSAFDHINVRRLFIVLEKAIATASKFFLFEFNDEFTRSQFKNLVTPYLRDVQSRRGITDFLVVCDATNNTAERVDRNEFWGDIYIKPARSINFIQLNFVAVRSGVQFSEIVGKF